jgi:diguanylate cyclase (GGDEF)-like protein/PAS domain S-box-containing protein
VVLDVTRQRMPEKIFRSLLEGTARHTGADFLRELVQQLAQLLGVRYAFVGELVPGQPGRVRTVALSVHGRPAGNIEYALLDTPCANVVGKQTCIYQSGVQAAFPRDHLLQQMQVDSYMGTPLYRSSGEPMGLLVVLDDKPLADEDALHAAFEIFASRAGAELERLRTHEEIEASEVRYRRLVESIEYSHFVYSQDTKGVFTYLSPSITALLGYQPQEFKQHYQTFLTDHPANRKAIEASELAIQGQKQPPFELEICHKDGSLRWLEVNEMPILNDEGQVVSVDGIAHDITGRKLAMQRLVESERRFRLMIDNAADAVFVHDMKGRVVEVNSRACDNLGYTREELLAMSVADVDEEAGRGRHDELWRQLDTLGVATVTGMHRRKDGTRFPVEVRLAMIALDDRPCVLALARDVSERKAAEEYQRLAAEVFENTSEGIMVTDPSGQILMVNRAFTEITGFQPEEAIGRTPAILKSGWHDEDYYRAMWSAIQETGRWQGEIRNRRKNGELYPAWLTLSAVKDDQGRIINYVGVQADISLRKDVEDRLAYLAHHDPLTGMPNRSLLLERMKHALHRAHRNGGKVGLMFIDLDRFKNINDTLGHDVGDMLLKAVAGRLTCSVREGDTIARLGGDEFVILQEDCAGEAAVATLAQKIVELLGQPFMVGEQEIYTSTSVGICLYPADGQDIQTLLKNADVAMYQAKEFGRNNYQFYKADINAKALERLNLEYSLRRALERQEFVLHYQPVVNVQSGAIVGMEALIRWVHPELGMVSPAQFIPLAEETGLILPIGDWVLETACRQAKAWQDAGLGTPRLAVNLSTRQFVQQNLVEKVESALLAAGLAPEFLELEITESVLMQDLENTISVLTRLSDMAVRLSIDDFGTGYSSLSYLKRFPLHTLKIDQSFVRDIPGDPDDAAIASTIIAMSHALRLDAIAEGVETQAQRDFLQGKGCDNFQGYLFSRPVPADAFTGLLQKALS